MVIIETRDLIREYKTYRRAEGGWSAIKGFFHRQSEIRVALKPTTLSIPKGQIVGLVGANGAGKTTLLKILSGLIYPSGGEVSVLGFKPFERKADFLRQISILLGQKAQLWWDLPAADSFSLLADIYGLDKARAKKEWLALAERLGCVDQLYVQLRRLSLGERMKMEIIGSLLHRPRVLFLDEPTIGLDVLAQNTIRRFLAEYVVEHEPTVILTSHYMDDISRLANRLLLISQGAIVYDGSVGGFVAHAERHLGVDIQSEETDFEDVIHRFFEKESRGRAPRDPVST
ncbi:MAG: ATP-binding cassette domain-containing protein [Bdellovibrionales bacterium]